MLLATASDVTPSQAKDFFETRFWGALWAAKHAIRKRRDRRGEINLA